MTSDDAVASVIALLEEVGIPYMLVGSMSSNFYGIARSSRDADILLQLEGQDLNRIVPRLPPAMMFDPQSTFETATFTTKNLIKLTGSPFEIELFHLTDDAHDQIRFSRRRRIKYGQFDAWIPSAEDVVVTKLLWLLRLNRSKDREDVRDVIAVQQNNLDWPYIETWCDKHGTRQLLEGIRQEVAGI